MSSSISVRRCHTPLPWCAIILLAAAVSAVAHVGAPPVSLQRAALPTAIVQQVVLPSTAVAAELAADAKVGKGLPLRFAVPRNVEFTPGTSGSWEQLPDGRLWRLRVVSTNATDLNFGFTQFWLPPGASLYVLSESDNYYQGPYTAADNSPAGQLWTPVVPGEAATVELFVPTGVKQEPRLVLTQVGAGYRDLFHRRKDLSNPKIESCEIDVVCPQGAPWTNEVRSVARILISGVYLCTGTLVMDAPGDSRPFFLTANHCEVTAANAATVVVYWNYESPTCGQLWGGSLDQNQTGATFRAAKSDVDFCLIELNQLPPASYNVYYAGWDRSGTAPAGCVGIHHPNGDVKAISFSSNPLTTIDSCIGTGGSGTHWEVTWTSGVTEKGSSGSGIWDPVAHKLVGTLSGGESDCATPTLPDCYGKFSVAWDSGSSSASRLRDWLDPQKTGVSSVAGSDPLPLVGVPAPAGVTLVAEGCLPANGVVDPEEVVTVSLGLQNVGTAPTTNLVATLLATNGITGPSGSQTYGSLDAGGAAVARPFTFLATGACGGTIAPVLRLQDGTRNLGTATFSLVLGAANLSAAQNFDGVIPPALPSGWSSTPAGVWLTTTTQRDTLPNSAFAPEAGSVTDYQLTSPLIPITSTNAQLAFRHYYDTENGYDGGVLEISIKGGAFADVLSAGGSFASGGYNDTISTLYGNPLAGRAAWTGDSGGFVSAVVNLPATAAGGNIQLRWRLGNDSSVAVTGWYVDTVAIIEGYTCCTGAPPASLSGVTCNSNRQFLFTVTGGAGYPYAVLASTNLSNWVALETNLSPFTFIDSNSAAFPRRFYRTRSP